MLPCAPTIAYADRSHGDTLGERLPVRTSAEEGAAGALAGWLALGHELDPRLRESAQLGLVAFRPLFRRGVLRRCSRRAASTYGRIALGPQPLVLFVSWTRRVKRRERGRHRVSQILKASGEFGAADGASPAEEPLGALESLAELLVRSHRGTQPRTVARASRRSGAGAGERQNRCGQMAAWWTGGWSTRAHEARERAGVLEPEAEVEQTARIRRVKGGLSCSPALRGP